METFGSSERSGTPGGLNSLAPASPVSHTVTPGVGKGSLTPGICGPRHGMSFGWWDRNGSCLRTYQASFLEVTDGRATGSPFLESFPSWGLMLDGEFIAQPTPGRRTSENGGGCWPTPSASPSGFYAESEETTSNRPDSDRFMTLPRAAVQWPTPAASSGGTHTGISAETARNELARGNQIGLGAAAALWPTPKANEPGMSAKTSDRPVEKSTHLTTQVALSEGLINPDTGRLWPTPDAFNDPKSGGSSPHQPSWADSKQQIHLHHAVKLWPTPRAIYGEHPGMKDPSHLTGAAQIVEMLPTPKATDWKGSGTSQKAIDREADHFNLWGVVSKRNQIPTPLDVDPGSVGGSLNPDWVEQHLMSLPEGWTRLEPVPDGAYDEWFEAMRDGTWWYTERGLPRVTTGVENRVNRLKMLGNGIVPATLALFLTEE